MALSLGAGNAVSHEFRIVCFETALGDAVVSRIVGLNGAIIALHSETVQEMY